jgi:hypothetical protein
MGVGEGKAPGGYVSSVEQRIVAGMGAEAGEEVYSPPRSAPNKIDSWGAPTHQEIVTGPLLPAPTPEGRGAWGIATRPGPNKNKHG